MPPDRLRRSSPAPNSLPPICTVLVAVTFDDRTHDLLQAAERIAGQLDANLVLLHACEMRDYAPACATPDQYDHWKSAVHDRVAGELDQLKANFPGSPRLLAARTVVMPGYLEDVIETAVEDTGAGLVLVSEPACRGLRRLLGGDRTAAVVHRAGCPVLIVPVAGTEKTF